MDILDIAIRVFIWAVVLALSIIPGIMMGSLVEVIFGPKWLFWPGFIIGVLAFVLFFGEHLYGQTDSDQEKNVSPYTVYRRAKFAKRMFKDK